VDYRNLICFDFETGSRYPETTEIVQIGACAIKRNNLEIVGQFQSLVKPEDFDALEDEALPVNGLTKEQLKEAPECSTVFPMFAEWIRKYNINKDKNPFGAPIPVFFNGDNFDMPIMSRYCNKYGYWNSKRNEQSVLYSTMSFDVMKHMWLWTRNNSELKNNRLVTILEYMGVPKEEIEKGAHDALWDTMWTARIAIKLLKLAEHLTEINTETKTRKLNIKNTFACMFEKNE